MMKKYIMAAMTGILLTGFASCSDDKMPDITPADRGSVTDDKGNVYGWVRIGDLLWTTSNAKNGTPLSEAEYYTGMWNDYVLGSDEVIQEYEENYLPVYGNMMTMEDAVASAPEGWRLPTDEDWKKLERILGIGNVDAKGYRGEGVAYSLLPSDSGCELGLVFGGGCFLQQVYGWVECNQDYIGEHGYYWTSTIDDSYQEDYPMAYFRKITVNFGKVERACMRSDSYLSVRWVKDAE